jgi:hypothetical protein
MMDLLHSNLGVSSVSEPPETESLRASIDAFIASLTVAHPSMLSRAPVCDIEHIVALLHMSLDHCRHLVAAYDALMSEPVWLFEPLGGEADADGPNDHEAGDHEDIPF